MWITKIVEWVPPRWLRETISFETNILVDGGLDLVDVAHDFLDHTFLVCHHALIDNIKLHFHVLVDFCGHIIARSQVLTKFKIKKRCSKL